MSYMGAYLGAPRIVVPSTTSGTTSSSPVASPYTTTQPQYYDFAEKAIDRLCEYAKAKA